MQYEKKMPANAFFVLLFWAILIWFLATILFLGSGCNTIAPKLPKAQQASVDGNTADSGVISRLTNGPNVGSYVVTSNWIARYNGMIPIFGTTNYSFFPPLTTNSGITIYDLTNGLFLVDTEHLADFGKMNQSLRSNR